MQADLPHTLYKRRKDNRGKKGGKNATRKPQKVRAGDDAFRLQQEAYERKKARLKALSEGREPFTTNELFQ